MGSARQKLLHLWSENHNLTRRVLAITARHPELRRRPTIRFRAARRRARSFRKENVPGPPRTSRIAEFHREIRVRRVCEWIAQSFRAKAPAPVVYLVAPALRFDPATGILLRYLNPQMQVVRVGLAESWRSGLSVVLGQ